jgi:hypothetical protein
VCARAARKTPRPPVARGSAERSWTIRSDPSRPQRAKKTAPSLHTLLLNPGSKLYNSTKPLHRSEALANIFRRILTMKRLFIFSLAGRARSLSFVLGPVEERCIGEAVRAKSLIAGDWSCMNHNGTSSLDVDMAVAIRSPSGTNLFEKHDAYGHFAVTTFVNGLHRICIFNESPTSKIVTINLKVSLN